MTEQHQEQQQYLSPVSPGKRLREAREAAGLTRGEVALHMRINERKVAALEEDDYALFPSETFVSGYLRSYAKVLGLPESDFIRPVSSTQLPPTLLPTSSNKKQATSMDLPVRMVTYVIIVVIIASLAAWWISQRGKVTVKPDERASTMQDEASRPAIETVVAEPQPSMPVVEEGTVVEESAVVEEGATEVTAAAPAIATEPPQNNAAVAKPSPPQAPSRPLATPPMVVALNSAAGNDAAVTADEPAPPPLGADTPISKLVLEYQNDSWTEVDDNAGRRLVYGLMRAGQTIEIRGEAPFKVFLGLAEGVTIHYNNDLFDFAPFRRGDVARFRIGRAEHNQPGPR